MNETTWQGMALDDRLKAVRRFVARPAREATGGNPAAFEDAVQEGVIAAWKLLDENPAAPLSWALRAAKFAALNSVRGRRQTGAPERSHNSAPTRTLASVEAMTEAREEEGYAEPVAFRTPSADATIDRLDVVRAVRGLCDDDRLLVWLRIWEGRTETEAAQILGISRALAYQRWTHRIAPALRASLAA